MANVQVASGSSEVEHTYLITIWIRMVWNGSNLSLKLVNVSERLGTVVIYLAIQVYK